jgi:hypothetical protein
MTEKQIEDKLKLLLTEGFLTDLKLVYELSGWTYTDDAVEVGKWVENLFEVSGKPIPEIDPIYPEDWL